MKVKVNSYSESTRMRLIDVTRVPRVVLCFILCIVIVDFVLLCASGRRPASC